MPENTHLEMVSAEAGRLPETPIELAPDLDAVVTAAADLGR
jgi:hypothetical protein